MPHISVAALQSSSHYDVVMTLSDGLLAMVAEQPAYGGEMVANALRRVRDIIWAAPEKGSIAFSTAAEKGRMAAYREVLLGLGDDIACRQFLEAYARLGHLYEIASLVARENVINRELEGFAPGGVREFVTSCESAQLAAEALSKPIFEMVMTAHPTNVNALNSIKAQRALGQAIDAARTGAGREAVEQALRRYLETPLLHGESGEMENLTVQDETEFTLYYLNNLYDDLPAIYAGMDDALRRKGSYDPLALDLKLRFGSWGSSGDKDGNAKVTADTTLDAIARHSCAILDRYTESLRALDEPALKAWLDRIDAARQSIADLQRRIVAIGKGGGIPPRQFDELSCELAAHSLDIGEFEWAVAQVYRSTGSERALDLLRRIRIFGCAFAKIEYRENAGEYSRVVGELIEGYLEMPLEKRETLLTRLLQEPQKIAALYAIAKPRLLARGAGRSYRDDDAAPIAYNTLKRMELARDFPNVVRDNVLAEFTHPAQLLEALVLQQAVREGRKEAAQLGVVPLFESPESMAEAASIMERLWKNPTYRSHMQAIAAREGVEQPLQEVQIAHSDNARRSGLPAARAFIYATHRELRETGRRHNVMLRFFEGGSSSDIYRGGVRATSAAVRAYGLHDFAKFTFQGGDMLNYLNYTPSTKRIFVRNFSHSAAFHVHKVELASTTAWDAKESAPRLAVRDRQMTAMADEIVCSALKSTLDDYRDNAFTRTGLGHLLRELEYDEEKLAGAAGSRAPARGGQNPAQESAGTGARVAFRHVGGTHMAEAQAVDIHKTRTITFSEALQHGGLVPTIVGSRTIYKNLRREINALRVDISLKERQGEPLTNGEQALKACYSLSAPEDAQLPAGAIRFLFRQSRLLRDVVIRLAIGVALTDFDMMRISHPHLRNDPFLDQLENECREAANIVCAAFTGKFPEDLVPGKRGRAGFDAISTNRLRHLMVARFPEMQQVLEDKSRYLSFLQVLKAGARERARHGAGMDAYCRRLAHAAGDTVTHGRMVPTDDPAYGRYVRHKLRSAWRLEEMQTA